jgi:membrane-associated phospholipid phosphatase
MRELKSTISNNKAFLIPWIIFIAIGPVLLLGYAKPQVTLFANSNHSQFLDLFFSWVTYLGEAPMIVLVLVLSLFKSIRLFLMSVLAFALNGIFIAITKFWVFGPLPRPRRFINDDSLLHFIEGVEMHYRFTFPSGHTTTAFVACLLLSFIASKNWMKMLLFVLACLIAYSRMYLAQHFFQDIYFGSIAGVVIALICISFMQSRNKPNWDKSLIWRK